MGQYYISVNLKKREFISPWDFENGAKLMEHSWVGNKYTDAVEKLLSPGGRWCGDSIVWAGDYMDEGLFLKNEKPVVIDGEKRQTHEISLYHYAYEKFKKLEPESIVTPKHGIGQYIVNHTKKEYVDKDHCPKTIDYSSNDGSDSGWTVHPLSLLVSSGNGRGGGDYTSGNAFKKVGLWVGDQISVEHEIPDGYKEFRPNFIEGDNIRNITTGDEDTPITEIPERIKKYCKEKKEKPVVKRAYALLALSMDETAHPLPKETKSMLKKIISAGKETRTVEEVLGIVCSSQRILDLGEKKFFKNMSKESKRQGRVLDFTDHNERFQRTVSQFLLAKLTTFLKDEDFDTILPFLKHCIGNNGIEFLKKADASFVDELLSKVVGYLSATEKQKTGGKPTVEIIPF